MAVRRFIAHQRVDRALILPLMTGFRGTLKQYLGDGSLTVHEEFPSESTEYKGIGNHLACVRIARR